MVLKHKFAIAKVDDYGGHLTLTGYEKDTREEAVTEIERLLNAGMMGSHTYTIVETWTEGR